jgi:hypothetical protein
MAGTSIYHCPNIPACLRVKTLLEFHADRELDQPIELLFRYTGKGNNLNGVLTSIYSLGKVIEQIERKLRQQELGKQKVRNARIQQGGGKW